MGAKMLGSMCSLAMPLTRGNVERCDIIGPSEGDVTTCIGLIQKAVINVMVVANN